MRVSQAAGPSSNRTDISGATGEERELKIMITTTEQRLKSSCPLFGIISGLFVNIKDLTIWHHIISYKLYCNISYILSFLQNKW